MYRILLAFSLPTTTCHATVSERRSFQAPSLTNVLPTFGICTWSHTCTTTIPLLLMWQNGILKFRTVLVPFLRGGHNQETSAGSFRAARSLCLSVPGILKHCSRQPDLHACSFKQGATASSRTQLPGTASPRLALRLLFTLGVCCGDA